MKKIIFLLMISSSIYSQQSFEWSSTGVTDYVVTEVAGTAPEIYSKTINWIKENYLNPNEVITMTIENEKIRFQGLKKDMTCMGSVCSDGLYIIEITIKDGKYKFDPISLKFSSNAGSFEFPINGNLSMYYDKNGELRKGSKETLDNVTVLLNTLNNNLKNSINGIVKKEDW
jgi:hypothetical protein